MEKRHALVIGGTKGIGRAVAKTFAGNDYVVSVIGRQVPEKGKELKHASYWAADLLNTGIPLGILEDIIEKNGKIANIIFCQRYRGKDNMWEGEMAVSLTATKNIIEHLADKFDRAFDNSIVIISSVASWFVANEQPVSYHIAKAGIEQLVRYYAVVLGPKGIRVNSISPITILKDESKNFYLQNEQLLKIYKTITPLGRMGTAEEISEVALFLCSSKSSFITGQNIVVDGGVSLQLHESMARRLISQK